MGKIKDIAGQKFGKLTALYRLHNYSIKGGHAYWLCVCECGNLKEVAGGELRRGNVRSCGCLPKHEKHNLTGNRIYNIYRGIKTRCYNKNRQRYKNYGGRGIKMCDEWLHNPKAFYDWTMSHGYQDNLTIDRINVDGDYEPSNCRWVDMKTQANNRTNTKKYVIDGTSKTLSEWSKIYNIDYKLVYNRVNHLGWTIEKALEVK